MLLEWIFGLFLGLFVVNALFTLIIWGMRLLIWKMNGKSCRKPSFFVTFFAILSIRCVSGLIFSESGLHVALNIIIGLFSFAAAYSLYDKKNKEYERKTAHDRIHSFNIKRLD